MGASRLIQAQDPEKCHDRALRLLAHRARSTREVQERLLRIGFDPDVVDHELARLQRVGLLDDDAFAAGYTRYAVSVKKVGRRAVRSELVRKGIAPQIVDKQTSGLTDQSQEALAEALADRRVERLRQLDRRVAYARLSGFLLRRGFDPEIARRVTAKALDAEVIDD